MSTPWKVFIGFMLLNTFSLWLYNADLKAKLKKANAEQEQCQVQYLECKETQLQYLECKETQHIQSNDE